MSLYDNLIFGYRKIRDAVREHVMRDTIQFIGATVEDDAVNKRTKVTIAIPGLPTPTANHLLQGTGTEWAAVSGISTDRLTSGTLGYARGGTGQSTWAKGDLLYASAADTLAKLTIGATGKVLMAMPSGGTNIPFWAWYSNLYDAAGANRVDIGAAAAPYTNQVAAITADGGRAIRMTNKTGAASSKGDALQLYQTWVVSGTVQLSALVLDGVTMANTDAGRVYLEVVASDPDVTVWVWSDAARTTKVASGTSLGGWAGGGAVTLTASGGSGVSGTVTVCTESVSEATGVGTLGISNAVSLPSGGEAPFAGIMYSDGVADGSDVWVVTEGKAYIKTYDGAAMGGYLYLDTLRAPPDTGKVDCEIVRTVLYTDHGIARALERVTSGLVLAQIDRRGFGPPSGA